jgi:hypothetical protein
VFCLERNLEYRACVRTTGQCAPTVFPNSILVNAILRALSKLFRNVPTDQDPSLYLKTTVPETVPGEALLIFIRSVLQRC